MDITRRCDYACRILRAAYKSGDDYISVSAAAEEEDIPYAFARSIQHELVQAGLLKTVRGARGGMMLNCDPTKVTLRDLLEGLQGPLSVAICSADLDYCDKQETCVYNRMWQGADHMLNAYFAAITLSDLFEYGEDHPVIAKAMASGEAPAVSDEQKDDGVEVRASACHCFLHKISCPLDYCGE